MAKVVHLSSIHPALDQRVFHKEARSLARAGFEVVIVARSENGRTIDNVKIIPFEVNSAGRLARMYKGMPKMLTLALKVRGDAYHLHDPELLPVGVMLKMLGRRVVYDAHESLKGSVAAKYWIPKRWRRPLAFMVGEIEKGLARLLDGVVVANPRQTDPFPKRKTIVIQNLPTLDELVEAPEREYQTRPHSAAYIGRISRSRGVAEMCEAASLVRDDSFRLVLAGQFEPVGLYDELIGRAASERIRYEGVVDRRRLVELLSTVRIGLAIMHPTGNYLTNQPVKMFEYMMAGIPVIASDFDNYRQYIDRFQCGLTVSPHDPQQLADAIDWMLSNWSEAKEMGLRGQRAVKAGLNWESEAARLVDFYNSRIFRS